MKRILIFALFISSAPAFSSASCNYNNQNAPDACTARDVDELRQQFNEIYKDGLSSGDPSYRSAAVDSKRLLEEKLNGQCNSASYTTFPIGCKYDNLKWTINYLRDIKPSQDNSADSGSIDDGYNAKSTEYTENVVATENGTQVGGQTSGLPSDATSAAPVNTVQTSVPVPQNSDEDGGLLTRIWKIAQFVFFIALCVGLIWLWAYFAGSAKCPKCNKRNKFSDNESKILEKEVRYEEVKRTVKDSEGKTIRTYYETVPRNYRNVNYYMNCEECGHKWTHNAWERY